jgi:serine/threonine-protein kinase PknK
VEGSGHTWVRVFSCLIVYHPVVPEALSRQTAGLAAGTVLQDRYEVIRVLGSGGMATTHLVRDLLWDALVALKLLRAAEPELLEALRFEFALLRELYHPQLCQVHDFSPLGARTSGGDRTCFYTADFVPGTTLESWARSAAWQDVARPLCDALGALGVLHRARIRHGDFKPANVLVRLDGRGVLIDLGCARPLDARRSDHVSGTRDFLPPELLAGEPGDERADLFAVGVTLQKLCDACRTPPPAGVRDLAARLVRSRPSERPADVGEVLEALGVDPGQQAAVPDGVGRLVGRDAELAQVRSALAALFDRQPGPRVLSLLGPEGIGKSRLLREIKWEAQERGRVVETNAARPRAVDDLVARAAGLFQTGGLGALLRLRERFALEDWQPTVLLVDDAHHLTEGQRQLLVALTQSLEPNDPLLVVVTGPSDLSVGGASAARLELGPLTPAALAKWLGGSLGARALGALHTSTGGVPAALRVVLVELASGALSEQDLARKAQRLPLSERRRAVVASLGPRAQRALGLLTVLGQPASGDTLAELGADPVSVQELMGRGLFARDAAGIKLWCWGETEELLGALGARLAGDLHREVASWLERQLAALDPGEPRRAELGARIVRHLARGRDVEAARERLLAATSDHELCPLAWWRAAEAVAAVVADPELQLLAAALERTAGHARTARTRLLQLLRHAGTPDARCRIELELGRCELKLGDAPSAERRLQHALDAAPNPGIATHARGDLAQVFAKQGKYREALTLAEEALAAEPDAVLRADLLQTAGAAAGFLGQVDLARQRLEEAAGLLSSVAHPRRLVRALGSRGLVEYQTGELGAAAGHFRQALELAESHELVDQVATAALNLGTVCHQRGDYASALSAYQRGMIVAGALGQASTEAVLRFDLAKLYADLGLFERAELAVARCQLVAEGAGLPLVAAEAEAVRGEVRFASDDLPGARRSFEQARAVFQSHESLRERTEVELQLADVAFAAHDAGTAARLLDETEQRLPQLGAKDVRLRHRLGRVRQLAARGDSRAAAEAAEEAAQEAAELELFDVQGEAELCAARAWSDQGSPSLARRHRVAAREIWERASAALPAAVREAFWKHPRRAPAQPVPELSAPATGSGRERKLELLLDINKRLNSSLKTGELLERTMDAAIQLTGAERGFVLLVETGRGKAGLQVAAARHLDREQLTRSHLRFSRAIAEQVIETGVPVITANAQADARFSQNESVHAMQLQSVVCVPVLSPSGTLGALYLDHRFQPGRFAQEDVEILLAFSDQVAIALVNARLHDELKARHRELSRERQKVEELLRGQAEEIDRLQDQVRRGLTTPEQRYDYRGIVGTSPALRQVFALLDRVIETDLPVLIQGESGTGKELFARAIHTNHPGRRGPLVSVNCAALPESLLESELFGYERGAFTGADRSREGLLVKASGGTLLLDEVAEMPLPMQTKLLRALQEREVRPLGSTRVVPIDIRLVCATNRRLADEVEKGAFRADLYYRISGVEVVLPPLRDRAEDVPLLVHHLLAAIAERMGRHAPEITAQALRKLAGFSWPGNVRELENVVTKALVLCDGVRLTAADIELPRGSVRARVGLDRSGFREREAERIAEALSAHRWNVAKVARLLGIPRPTLYRKLRRYALVRDGDDAPDPQGGAQ